LQTLLNQGRRKRSVESVDAELPDSLLDLDLANKLESEDNHDPFADLDDDSDISIGTWLNRATKAVMPLAVAYFVEPRTGQEDSCVQRTLCEANAELRRRPDVRNVAASLLLT
jgi:hypothetical protein